MALPYRIPRRLVFPDPSRADPSGLLGVGGDLQPDRVLLAYRMGIFPWFSEGQPILWWSPDPRAVLFTRELRIQRSLRKVLRKRPYEIRLDTAFDAVIDACARVPRPDQDGTWITDGMLDCYKTLHRRGFAHSAEAWLDGQLVRGLYGIGVGKLFCGESMFAKANDASKIAFVHLAQQLRRWGYPLIDCQMTTDHLSRFGAREVARSRFLADVHTLGMRPGEVGAWRFDDDFELEL
jgi:leucyl/phenylalanyl-tRNA--protein transferase